MSKILSICSVIILALQQLIITLLKMNTVLQILFIVATAAVGIAAIIYNKKEADERHNELKDAIDESRDDGLF